MLVSFNGLAKLKLLNLIYIGGGWGHQLQKKIFPLFIYHCHPEPVEGQIMLTLDYREVFDELRLTAILAYKAYTLNLPRKPRPP